MTMAMDKLGEFLLLFKRLTAAERAEVLRMMRETVATGQFPADADERMQRVRMGAAS